MIKNFLHKGLENFFYEGTKKGINSQHTDKLERILEQLDASDDVEDMRYPGSDLHLLEPKNQGRWAVKVSKSWRVTFIFRDGDVWGVDYEQYH